MKILDIFKNTIKYIKARINAVKNAFDSRVIFFIVGLGSFSYGLWLFRPWLGFAIPGFILMSIGYLMKDKTL
jgi:hypothetical protein